MGRTCYGLRNSEDRRSPYRRRPDCLLPAKPCELQTSKARRVFKNRFAQEQFRQGAEEESARAFLDTAATGRELTPLLISGSWASTCNLRFPISCANAKTKSKAEGGTEMIKVAGQSLPNALIKVVDLLVENRIRIDAMEQLLVKTNPVVYELYRSAIENLQAQKAAEVTRTLSSFEINDRPASAE